MFLLTFSTIYNIQVTIMIRYLFSFSNNFNQILIKIIKTIDPHCLSTLYRIIKQ